jgi:hypothetical protein
MAAGLSRKQITSRIYRRLQAIARDLHRAGVHTQYNRATSTQYAHLVYFTSFDAPSMKEFIAPRPTVDGGFNVKFSISRASNGEVFGSPTIYVVLKGVHTNYGHWSNAYSFEQGIAYIKANFATPKGS